MTRASFAMDGSRIVSFTVEGHTGLAEAGEDILCAAVTSAVRLTECAVNDVLGLEAPVKVNQQDASVTLKLPAIWPERPTRCARRCWPP
ncbi:MAG: ribosomal-processing cysteine protease Prp [Evtepia gabavorous]